LVVGCAALALAATAATRAQAEAKLLIDAASGKVLFAENATRPWYPASVTKLMTTYTTLRAIKEGRISFNTLLTVSPEAASQPPTKMGFRPGTRVTVDNALKMMLVKSANDMAVTIAEGVGGSVAGFADMMNANAARLGMTQSHFVNPNGLPANDHYTSARDIGILARALIQEFPQDDFYWHIHSIRYGNRIIHNYNKLLDRYPGADGMKTGFICASGYNLVGSATRNGHRLIAIVFGAYSGKARTQEVAELLERGFESGPLAWLTPSLGTVDELKPIAAAPPDLHDEMCGPHRHKPPSEDNDEDAVAANGDANSAHAFMLSSLTGGKFVLGPPIDTTPPVVVFTGPADHPDVISATVSAKPKRHHHKKAATSAKPKHPQKTAAHTKAKGTKRIKPAKATKPSKRAEKTKQKKQTKVDTAKQ
jgi:D-alanyl-D-alanine carboxypeptidase